MPGVQIGFVHLEALYKILHQYYNLDRAIRSKKRMSHLGQWVVPIRIAEQFVHQGVDVRLGSAYARQWQLTLSVFQNKDPPNMPDHNSRFRRNRSTNSNNTAFSTPLSLTFLNLLDPERPWNTRIYPTRFIECVRCSNRLCPEI